MKRILLPYSLALMACIGATAAPVSRNAALVSAKRFLSDRGLDASSLTPVGNVRHMPRQKSIETDTYYNAPYHIFNLGDCNGFIVIAGDDRAQTVLAYSPEGRFSATEMPEACKAWLEVYASEINSLPADAGSTISHVPGLTYSSTPVAPLLTSKWDQKEPYNLDCPIDQQTGKQCVTGCVATSVAQLMYYYRYPAKATGSITYDDNIQKVTRTLDFSTLPAFDWDSMTETYGENSTEKQRSAVANLMNAAAHGIKMQFSPETSMAYHYEAGHALINYFGYDSNMHIYERAFMSDQEWIDLLTAEIEAGRPVIYNGQNPNMGHSFICDGHDGNGFFHFNWGWSGLSDGYFTLSALEPSMQSTGGSDSGYTHNQAMICKIAPQGLHSLTPQTDHLLNIDKLYFRDASAYYVAETTPVLQTKLKDAQLYFYSFNKGFSKFSGEACAAIVEDGKVTPIVTLKISELGSNAYTKLPFNLADATIADGTHLCAFFYRASDTDNWHRIAASSVNAPSECYITVNGEDLTFTTVKPDIDISLAAELSHGRLFTGAPVRWSFDLKNTGKTRFEAYAGVALIDKDSRYALVYTKPVLCPSGETINVDITKTLDNIQAGTYKTFPFISYVGDPAPENIIPLSEPATVNVENLVILPENGSYFIIDSQTPTLTISVSNMSSNQLSGRIESEIVKQDGTIMPGLFTTDIIVEPKGNSTFNLSASDLELEKGTHKMKFYMAPGRDIFIAEFPVIVSRDISALDRIGADSLEIRVETGYIYVAAPSALSSLTLYDLTGRIQRKNDAVDTNEISINTDGLANGVYILSVKPAKNAPIVKKISIRTQN